MTFSRARFLGSSVIDWNASVGWNDTPSSMTISLVDDIKNGDSFQAPAMGTPVFFNYEGWEFNGIVRNWGAIASTDGNPIYKVEVVDPREILDGVELILDGYTGVVSQVPNLFNVYGWLESFGFGNSGINESGIVWTKIKNAIQTMTLTPGIYGSAIQFRGYTYTVNLDGIPLVPETYRVGGTSITLLGFIQEMCEAASADFFITLSLLNDVRVINVHSISRRFQPNFGKITQFVSSIEGASAKNIGYELRNETTSKFVTGGAKQEMYFQTLQPGSASSGTDDTIAPYWGLYLNSNIAVGVGENDSHTVTLDSRMIDVPGVGPSYVTDVGELRAAVDSQVAWENFLWANNNNKFRQIYNEDGNLEDTDELNPHYKKAEKLKIVGNATKNLVSLLQGMSAAQIQNINLLNVLNTADGDPITNEEDINRLYEYIHEYAVEYYGKKFMVRIPFVSTATSDNGELILSREPTDGGFIDESKYLNAIASKFMPEEFDRVELQDGRLRAYARFDGAANYDFSLIDPEDVIVNSDGNTVFVRGDIEGDLVFINNTLKFSPRVVFNMPNPVIRKNRDFDGAIKNIFRTALEGDPTVGVGNAEGILDTIFSRIGSDALAGTNGGSAVLPNMIAIPLKSNIDSYGPWSAVGAQGKVEFEKDDTLVPWNYGGYTAMNLVGQAKVDIALANQQMAESGEVEFPGIPGIALGQQLINGGPYVTDVAVNISQGGVRTTYRMNTWTPQFGVFAKQRAEQVQKLAKQAQQDRRNYRQLVKNANVIQRNVRWQQKQLNIINRKKPSSSHQLLAGEVLSSDSGNTVSSHVVVTPTYNLLGKYEDTAYNKAAISLDGIFTPFLAIPTSGGYYPNGSGDVSFLPTYSIPRAQAETPRVTDLDRFIGTSYGYVGNVYGSGGDHNLPKAGMALRGPVIVAGWGYDTNGEIVPSVEYDYKNDLSKAKVGPLDIRWDEDRGVWAAGVTGGLRKGIVSEITSGALTGKFTLLKVNHSGIPYGLSDVDKYGVSFSNYLSIPLCSGQRCLFTKIGSNWEVVNAEYTGVDVVTNVTCDDENRIVATKRTIYLGSAFGDEKVCEE